MYIASRHWSRTVRRKTDLERTGNLGIETASCQYQTRVRFQNYSSIKAESNTKHAWYPPFRFLINNGRANHVWQSAFLDQHNALVSDRFPFPPLLMHPDDAAELGFEAGDLIEVWNSNGATQAIAWPEQQTRRGETFLLFAHPAGPAGNVVGPGTNELVIPNFKQTWADLRKLSDASEAVRHLSFKNQGYRAEA